MKIYIMTDLEGPAGVNLWDQTRVDDSPLKTAAKHLLTGEVNAAIEGILHTAPDAEITVLDGHGSGGLIFDELHPRACSIMHGRGLAAPFHLDPTFAAVFFIGQHAMEGTPNAPLCHTYSSRTIEYYKLNGAFIGEIGCFSAMAGDMGVPTAFLSGDDKACAEARAILPNIATAATKTGLGIELALHLSHKTSRVTIRNSAATATRTLPHAGTYTIPGPYELEIRVKENIPIAPYLAKGATQLDPRTILKHSDTLLGLFQ